MDLPVFSSPAERRAFYFPGAPQRYQRLGALFLALGKQIIHEVTSTKEVGISGHLSTGLTPDLLSPLKIISISECPISDPDAGSNCTGNQHE